MNIKVLPAAHHLDCYTGSASMLVFTMSNDVSAHAEKIRHLRVAPTKMIDFTFAPQLKWMYFFFVCFQV